VESKVKAATFVLIVLAVST